MTPKHFAALACAAAAFAATGCGKSAEKTTAATNSSSTAAVNSSSTATSNPQPVAPVILKHVPDPTAPSESHSSYATKMDKICTALSEHRTRRGPETAHELYRVGTAIAAYEQSVTLPKMEKLSPPKSLVSDWKKMIIAARTLPVYSQRIAQIVHTTGQISLSALRPLSNAHLTAETTAIEIAQKDHLKAGLNGCLHQI